MTSDSTASTAAGFELDSIGDDSSGTGPGQAARRLSYKFQRLRERIRSAIAAGELVGKLPGERSLARQFNVNAKTLSKALTDLAAEGVLERSIGLGTFVRDGTIAPVKAKLLLIAPAESGSSLSAALAAHGVESQLHEPLADLPPSLVAPFDLVLVASPHVSEDVVRDLIVRGKSVITLDRLTSPYSTHALLPHTTRAATQTAMHLASLGHKRMLLIPDDPTDTSPQSAVADAVPGIEMRTVTAIAAILAVREGYTAAVVSGTAAGQLVSDFREAGILIPDTFSVMAYGRIADPKCCGHYVTNEMVAAAIADMLTAGLPYKPLTLWLTAQHMDLGTTAPPGGRMAESAGQAV